MRAFLAILLVATITFSTALGQTNLQPVPGFPPQQVYDLLVDKKGFLWIGHELGISRFDGLSFTHYSHPSLASLGMTDLMEDRFGRIWCHNFSSQLFYIENEQLHWVQQYEFAKEEQFPRMVLNGDELVVTSSRGLFVCNVATLQTRYLRTLNGKALRTNTLTLVGNKVVALNLGMNHQPVQWYLYESGKGVRQLKYSLEDLAKEVKLQHWALQPYAHKDTIYATCNPFGQLAKLMVRNDSMIMVQSVKANDFLNTVTKNGEDVWFHTRTRSSSNSGLSINNLNVSDVVAGMNGNIWVGSINKGLLVNKKNSESTVLSVEGIDKEDFIRSITVGASTILLGTQNGKVIVLDKTSKKTMYTYSPPYQTSAIEVARVLKEDLYFFSSSYTPFVMDARRKKVEPLDIKAVVKDAAVYNDILFLSTVSGLVLYPSPLNTAPVWHKPIDRILGAINYIREPNGLLFIKGGRSDAVVFDEWAHSILCSFKDGVYEISDKGIKPLTLLKERVYASSLEFARNKLLIGTFSNGLIIRQGDRVKRVTINEGMSSNNIIDMKVIGNHLWMYQNNAIQILDIDKETIITEVDLPVVVGSTMVDAAEVNDTAYISSTEGVYRVPLKSASVQYPIRSYITYVLANNKDTLLEKEAVLAYNRNDIQIHLAAPWYSSTQPIFFKYRLVGGGDEQWHITREPVVRFPSLMPGNYKFESLAVHPSGKSAEQSVSFEFEILKPWWEQWWFRILLITAVVVLFYFLYRYRLNQLLKVENIRRSISSDLHDDIGATLSSINIYTELAKRQENNKEFLSLIQDNTREIIGKLDDLVWSINPKNDSCEQLINRMRSFSEPLLTGANINYKITCSEDLHRVKLNTGIKRNLYLIFKETINNVAKHSRSKNCTINIYYQNKRLHIQIVDDGIGFDESTARKDRNGLKNIQERARQIRANIKIKSIRDQGTTVQLDTLV